MAKRTGGGEVDAADLRRLLIASVVEYGDRKLVGPHTLAIPPRALRAADNDGGKLATLELADGRLLLTYTPPAQRQSRSGRTTPWQNSMRALRWWTWTFGRS